MEGDNKGPRAFGWKKHFALRGRQIFPAGAIMCPHHTATAATADVPQQNGNAGHDEGNGGQPGNDERATQRSQGIWEANWLHRPGKMFFFYFVLHKSNSPLTVDDD